jgi:hypothetical protein
MVGLGAVQPPGHCGAGSSGGLEVAAEQLDVGAAGGEERQAAALAPGGELAQVQYVGLAGQAGIPGQEPG